MLQPRGRPAAIALPPAVKEHIKPADRSMHLIALRESIVVASENDPNRPEFPPFSPRFPATPTQEITIPALNRSILIKDESHNATGSHKDRMAWEIVVYYKTLIEDLLDPRSRTHDLPAASIISNGSAALAIQVMLRSFGLPALHVLLDESTADGIVARLKGLGCVVFKHNLAERELDSADVLVLTDNPTGFDVTARNLVDPTRRTYYDWLAYEILNLGARHIFIPVGTGDLFVNVLTVIRDEQIGGAADKRRAPGSQAIEGLQLLGATSNDHKTRMDKLYAKHRPTLTEAERIVAEMRDMGLCGQRSGIYEVKERSVERALRIAATNHIHCEASGIAGLSLLLQDWDRDAIPADEQILVVNTGWLPVT